MLKKGAQRIVLDLRGSAGGDLSEGVAVTDFLKSGRSTTLRRGDKVVASYERSPTTILPMFPW
jgi:C-terminal processing protease CtpA/Prc